MLRTALFVAITVVASPARAEVLQVKPGVMLDVKCATAEERTAMVQYLNSKVDWFLSRLEVPAAAIKQLNDTADFKSFVTHPWGSAHLFRLSAPHLKSRLASLLTETNYKRRLKEAITAYGVSFELAYMLTEHARINPDQRITDVGNWNGRALVLQGKFMEFAICLVDVPPEAPPKSP